MKIKFLALAIVLFWCADSRGQQIAFKSNDQAVKFINDICNKYWVKATGIELSREITAYQKGCDLYFSERTIINPNRDAVDGSGNEVNTTITNVKLSSAKLIGNDTTIEFVGGKKDLIIVNYKGNNEYNNKPPFAARFRLSLDYNNGMLRENMNNMVLAIAYLQQQCRGKKPVKHKHSHKKA